MPERRRIGLGLAAIALIGAGCGPVREITKTIEPDGGMITETPCILKNPIFQDPSVAYECPKAVVIVDSGPGGSLTIHEAQSEGITMPFSNNAEMGGLGVADWCSVWYDVQAGKVIRMVQNCSYPPGE